MKNKLIDTNIIIIYLVEDTENKKFQQVFELFERVEKKDEIVIITEVVLAEAYFVLTKFYEIPRQIVCEKLLAIIEFSGINMADKNITIKVLERLKTKNIDFVDAFLIEQSLNSNIIVYTADKDLIKSEANTEKLY